MAIKSPESVLDTASPTVMKANGGSPLSGNATAVSTAEDRRDAAADESTSRRGDRAGQGPDRRQTVVNRRMGLDRRHQTVEESGYTGPERRVSGERRSDTGLERRRGPGRRRSDDRKSAEEGEMSSEQFEFIMAIETYKKVNKKIYPTWTEVLEVVRQLGYRKILPRSINLQQVPESPIADR